MTIRDYLAILRQRWMIAVITIGITTTTAVFLSARAAPVYEAHSRILLRPVAVGDPGNAVLQKLLRFQGPVKTESEFLRSEEVARRVAARLNIQASPASLIARLKIASRANNPVIAVVASADDPNLAAALANAFPEEYIRFRAEQAVNDAADYSVELTDKIGEELARVTQVEAEMRVTDPNSAKFELMSRDRQASITRLSAYEQARQAIIGIELIIEERGFAEFVQYATAPLQRSNSDPIRAAVLGLIVGIPLALGLALLLDAMSDTIRTKEEAEKIVGADSLGVIPLSPDWRSTAPYIVTKEAPYSAAAEAYRTLRINLDSVGPTGEGRQILFTSPGMGEGKTLTSANVAVAFAEAGRSVLLVSADMRRPRLHTLFDVEPSPGLSDLLREDADAEQLILEPSPNLYLLPSGSGEDRPDQLLGRVPLREVLSEMLLPRRKPSRSEGRGNGGYHRNGTGNEPGGKPRGNGKGGARSRKALVGVQPDVILLDAPSVLGAAEVSVMAAAVDGVVLVLHAGVTRRQAAGRAAEQIRRAGGKIAGVVLVGVRLDNDYSVYPPVSPDSESAPSDSTWAKVVAGLRR